MNKRKSLFVLGALVASATLFAADLDRPWGRWDASGATDYIPAYGNHFYTRLIDLSGNGHDLHLDYNIQPAPSSGQYHRFRQSLYCDGMSDTDLEGTAPAFNGFTVSFWMRRDSLTSRYPEGTEVYLVNGLNGLTVKSVSGSDIYDVYLDGVATTVKLRITGKKSDYWHHLVFSVGDGKVAAYLDGICTGTDDCPSHVGTAGTFFLFGPSGSSRAGFTGPVDDVRIYDAAVTAEEAVLLYEKCNDPRLTAHWPCERVDETDGLRTTPNLVDDTRPLELGAGVSLVTHPDGEKALSFSDSAETNQCYAHTPITKGMVKENFNDLTFMMRCRKSRALSKSPHLLEFYGDGYGSYSFYALVNTGYPTWNYLDTGMFGGTVEYPCLGTPDQWCHFAWTIEYTYRLNDDASMERFRRTRTYRNGELVTTSEWVSDEKDSYYTGFPLNAQDIYVGNNRNFSAPLRGEISDVRIYQGKVTPEFVREVYRGPAAVDAGADFTVRGAEAELHGVLSPNAARPSAAGFAGAGVWSQVSGPAEAAIANVRSTVTRVTLPAEGTYAFRLSNTAGGETVFDEVSVTRAAAVENAAPEVACTVKTATGLCAVVEATATDGDGDALRLRWQKVSGPGGVWFSSENAADPAVTFSAPGEYTLSCTASDGQDATTATVTLTVTGTTLDDQLNEGLRAYWPCDFAVADNGQGTYPVDTVAGRQLMPMVCGLNEGAGYGLGVDGSYGIRCADELTAYWQPDPALPHSEGSIKMSDKEVPQEEWKTFSCWMYHDGSYLTPLNVCALYSVVSYQMFLYLPNLGGVPCFRICQCDAVSTADIFSTFTGPAENLTNRWVHVVFQANQHKTADHEVWVNGRKLAVQTMDLRLGRYVEKGACIGGNGYEYRQYAPESYNYDVDPGNASIKYPFPGRLDEIRIYGRHLSEAEIRYLYEHPTATAEALAPNVTVSLKDVRMATRGSRSVSAEAFAATAEKPLTYTWSVCAGDASKLKIANPHALQTTVVAAPCSAGEYALALEVFDGERTTYSEPIRVTVDRSGMTLTIR